MNIWRVLGLQPTRDVAAIRRAYANAARQYHPEEQPEEFKRVRSAYEHAMAYARSTPHQSTISGGGAESPPPSKKYNALGNKAVPKKGVATGGSYAGPVRRPAPRAGSRRPRAEARIEPLERRRGGPEPDWLREATSEGQAELFRQAPAMAAFQEVWQKERQRGDKKTWREYFSSPVFLAVQREEGFAAALLDFVEKEVKNGVQLSQKFLLELAIAYGIRYRSGHEMYYLSFAAFSGIDSIRNILKLGRPLDRLTHEEDKVWAACWRDYFELLSLAKNGGFENPDRTRRWKELFDRYRKEKITEKPEVTRKDEDDVEYRHPYGLRLLASFVQKHPLPPAAVQYLYDSLQLETVGRSSAKRWYKPLLDAVLPVLPDQGPVRAEKEALAVVKSAVDSFLKVYDRRSPFPHTDALRAYDTAATPEEMHAAGAVVEMPQFRQLLLAGRLEESEIIDRLLGTPTALIQALTASLLRQPDAPGAKKLLGRCLDATHRWAHEPEYFFDAPFTFAGASPDDIGLENHEFWCYYLSTAFPAAFSTENEQFIAKVMKAYPPSRWWRQLFTGFDDSARRILAPRSRTFPLGEHALTVEFHFFYQRLLVDGEEKTEVFPWPDFLALVGDDDLLFWLALPLAMGEDAARRTIRREILSRMRAISLEDLNSGKLADCLVNHVCTSRKETAAARGYGEDGCVLYGYEVRQNRTLEVYSTVGILRHRKKLWDHPFPTVEAAQQAGRAYLETLLDPPAPPLLRTVPVTGMTPRQKAAALVHCLGEGVYTQEDHQRDSKVQLNATRDFLGYGVQHEGRYTADFYRANLHRPCRAMLRFGTQPGERFALELCLTVWPFGSPEAQKERTAQLFTRIGTLGEACYVMGTIQLGEKGRSFTLISSSSRRCLYALSDQDQRSYSGKDLSSLVETMLYPSEWDAVAQVEQYEGAAEDAPEKE